MQRNNITICVFLLMFVASICGASDERRVYEETVINPSDEEAAATMPPMGSMMSDMSASSMAVSADTSLKLTWKLPVDWVEGEKNAMRLASFSTGSAENRVDCSIVALGGNAGGLEANVMRWMRQINLTLALAEELSAFMAESEKFKNANGIEGNLIDFTLLQKSTDGKAPSIVAFVFPFNEKNVFVKMAGPKSELVKNNAKFKAFCRSLKVDQ